MHYITSIQFFQIFNFFCFIIPSILSLCMDMNFPIMKENECVIGCELSEYKSGICTIDNDAIKTQWFTSIIIFTEEGYKYALITTTENGNLIVSSNRYDAPNSLKYYYGLRNNGRPYFENNAKKTPFTSTNSDKERFEGNLFGIKLKGDNSNKEYIIGFGNNEANFEIYDFENNNEIYKQQGLTFFNTKNNYFHSAAVLKLDSEENYYIIGII